MTRLRIALAASVAALGVLLALFGSGTPSTPTVAPARSPLSVAAFTSVDHGWARERDRGNRGHGITVAVSEQDHGYHGARMCARITRIVPDARIILVTADGAGIRSAAQQGAAVIACPWAQSGLTDDVDAAIREVSGYGCLLFGAAGNGAYETGWPAAHPLVYSCAAGWSDGRLDPTGSPGSGRIDVVMAGDEKSSGATADAAGIAVQWLGYGQHLYRTAGRREAFGVWLRSQGIPGPRGSVFPCWRW